MGISLSERFRGEGKGVLFELTMLIGWAMCWALPASAIDVGNPKDPVICVETVREPNGGFHNVNIHGQFVNAKRAAPAKDCLESLKDELKKRALDDLNKGVSDDCIAKAKASMGAAGVIDDKLFNEMLKADPEVSKRGNVGAFARQKDGLIFIRESTWNNPEISTQQKTRLLTHEGVHVALDCARQNSLRRQMDTSSASQEKVIKDLLKNACNK